MKVLKIYFHLFLALSIGFLSIEFFSSCQFGASSEPNASFSFAVPDSSLLDYDKLIINLEKDGKREEIFSKKLVSLNELNDLQTALYKKGNAVKIIIQGIIGADTVYEESSDYDGTHFSAPVISKRPGKNGRIDVGSNFNIPRGVVLEVPFKAIFDSGSTVMLIRWSMDNKKSWSEKKGPWSGTSIDLTTNPLGPFHLDEDDVLYLEVYLTDHIKISGQKHLTIGLGGNINKPPKIFVLHPIRYGIIGDSVALSVEAEDPDGRLAGFKWDFESDGKTDSAGDLNEVHSEIVVKHIFNNIGPMQVTLHVTDNRGDEAVGAITVNLVDAAVALADLKVTPGAFKTLFEPGKTEMEAIIPFGTTSVNLVLPVKTIGATVSVLDAAGKPVDAAKPVAVKAGENLFNINVTNGTKHETYSLILRQPAADAPSDNELAELTVDGAAFTGGLVKGKFNYETEIIGDAQSIQFHAKASDTLATMVLDSTTELHAAGDSAKVSLRGPTTLFVIKVTAQNGISINYQITVIRKKSSDAALSDLVVDGGTISPQFSPDQGNYSVNLPKAGSTVTLKAFLHSSKAKVTIDGAAAISGQLVTVDSLALGGIRTVKFVIEAEDGKTRTISVTITRDAADDVNLSSLMLSPVPTKQIFNRNVTDYSCEVDAKTDKVFLSAHAETPGATLEAGLDLMAKPMRADEPIEVALVNGSNSLIVRVKGPSGSQKTYTVRINRLSGGNANLLSLSLGAIALDSAFDVNDTNYSANLGIGIPSAIVTAIKSDPAATLQIDGKDLKSGSASAPIFIDPGKTVSVTLTTIALDGVTTKRVHIEMIRAASSVNTLADVKLSVGAFVFDKSKAIFSIPLPNAISTLSLTATLSDSLASMTIGGKAALSNQAITVSDILELTDRKVDVIITAQDKTTKTYTFIFQRAGSGNANLKYLVINPGNNIMDLTAAAPYALSVTNAITQGNLTFDVEVATSKVYLLPDTTNALIVNKASTDFGFIEGGVTPVQIRVVALDGSKKLYVINVTRPLKPKGTTSTLANLTATAPCTLAAFSPGTASYSCNINATATAPTLTGVLVAGTTLSIKGGNIAGNSTVVNPAIGTVDSTIFKVTSEDGNASTSYTIKVTRLSNAVTLTNLVGSGACLLQPFAPTTTIYSCTIPFNAAAITLTASPTPGTTLAISAGTVTGNSTVLNPLEGANQSATFTITAADGTTGTYTVSVNRQSSVNLLASLVASGCTMSPASYSAASNNYSCSIGPGAAAPVFTASQTAKTTVQMEISGSNAPGLAMTLNPSVGSSLSGAFYTTPESPGAPVRKDIVTVTRINNAANLSNLVGSGSCVLQSFVPTNLAYTCNIPHTAASVTFTASLVSGTTLVISGGTGATATTTTLSPSEGTNAAASFIVTAADGITKNTYTVSVYKQSSTNTLANLTASGCTLSSSYSAATYSYSCTISSTATAPIITATANTKTSVQMKVNGVNVTGLSNSVSPLSGSAAVAALYTTPESPAGVVRKDSVTVYRQSNSNGLTALSISGIPVLVAPDMLINVANTTTAITLMPTASAGTIGYRAGISGDWTTISSGAKSASINIGGPGTTTIIQILTTAQDPGVTTPYKISVIRPADGNVELGSLFVNGVAVDLPATNDQSIGFYVEADINSASIVASAKSATSTVAVLPGSTLLLGNHGSVTNATIRVTAQNRTWQNYYLAVHRKNAYLRSITFDQPYEPGFLWSDFGPYTLRVPGIYSLTITPTLFDGAVYPMELYVDGTYIETLTDGVRTTFSLPNEVNSTIEIKVHSGDGYSTYTFLATD